MYETEKQQRGNLTFSTGIWLNVIIFSVVSVNLSSDYSVKHSEVNVQNALKNKMQIFWNNLFSIMRSLK